MTAFDKSPQTPAPLSFVWRHPPFLGICAGAVLSVLIAIHCPVAALKPGDSRILMALAGAIFLVPGCIATAYALPAAKRGVQQIPRLRVIWLVAVLFFTFAVLTGASAERRIARRFAAEGRSTQGTVVEIHPENHDQILVAYNISGTDYRTLSAGPDVARNYKPGQAIQVYYFVSAPAQGFCTEPQWSLGSVIVDWVVAAGVFPLWAIAILGSIELRRHQKLYKS